MLSGSRDRAVQWGQWRSLHDRLPGAQCDAVVPARGSAPVPARQGEHAVRPEELSGVHRCGHVHGLDNNICVHLNVAQRML